MCALGSTAPRLHCCKCGCLTTAAPVLPATCLCTAHHSLCLCCLLLASVMQGLGEMMPEQLWSTTLNPETRTLRKLTIEDAGG